jgi:MFS family permease
MRLVIAYLLYALCEYGLWIAMLVYAYDQGGASTAGVVAVAQLVPAAGVALVVAPLAERTSPVAVLVGGYAVVALGAAAAAVSLLAGLPTLATYTGAVVASAAMAAARPAQSSLLPALSSHASELTACNVAIGWAENLSVLVSGVAVGVVLAVGSVGHAYAGATVLMVGAVLLTLPLRGLTLTRRRSTAGDPDGEGRVRGESETMQLWRDRPARLLVGLLALEYLVIGALDLLFVVMAIDVLDAGQSWAGYLNTAYGAGAVLLGLLGALLVGRRLGPVIVVTALGLGLALVATVAADLVLVVVLLGVVGGARTLFNTAVRVLLQRSVPPQRLAGLFGLSEGLNMSCLAAGSVFVPVLVSIGGPTLAIVGTAVLLPAAVAARLFVLFRIDEQARLPVVEIALLQRIPLFRSLPSETLEALAAGLEEVELEPGTVLMREGEEGDYYFAIGHGTVDIQQKGTTIRTMGRAEGLGEIALLRSTPRTATAIATTRVTAFRLDRASFLGAVLGHASTLETARAVVDEHRTRDASRSDPTRTPDP